MEIRERKEGKVTIVDIVGDLNIGGTAPLRRVLSECISRGDCDIIVNLSQVPYIDSSGLGMLVAGYTSAVRNGGTLKIAGLGRSLERVFRLVRLTNFFEIYTTVEEALRSYGS
ncbi:MAG: STAS domain-containing protein [bacterium]